MKTGKAYYTNLLSICIARLFLAAMLLFTVQPTLVKLDLFPGADTLSHITHHTDNSAPQKGELEKEYSESFKGFSHVHHQPVCNDSIIFNYIAEIPVSLTGVTMDILIPPPKTMERIA